MSRVPLIGFVCEGDTDIMILHRLVEFFLDGREFRATFIQPPISAYANHQGLLGGGWKGVLKWCENEAATRDGLVNSLELANCDCLIIHVDADIAEEPDLGEHGLSSPCPPARAACDRVRRHITTLLGGAMPPQVVLCVPAQCTEAWVFCALHPDNIDKYRPIECRKEVERLLIGKPDRLVRDKDGAAKKQKDRYRAAAAKVVRGWSNATKHCPEAERFEAECRSALH